MSGLSEKKERELTCLRKAFEYGLKRGGGTRRMIEKLQGEILDCDDSERPDFVIRTKAGFLLGVEHFVADQASEESMKKPGSYLGHSVEQEAAARRVYEEYREEVLSGSDCLGRLGGDLADLMAGALELQRNSTYASFVNHFNYVVNKHLRNAQGYRTNIANRFSVSCKSVKLAFLIDIRSSFERFFVNNPSGKCHRCDSGELPIFEDIVEILEILKGKVDYVFLAAEPVFSGKEPEVLVVDCSNVRRSFERQGKRPCVFAGSELAFDDGGGIARDFKVKGDANHDGDALNINVTCNYKQVDGTTMLESGFCGAKVAWAAKRKRKPFVADIPVQALMVQYGDSIVGWRDADKVAGEIFDRPILEAYDSGKGSERLEAFCARWIVDSDEHPGNSEGK